MGMSLNLGKTHGRYASSERRFRLRSGSPRVGFADSVERDGHSLQFPLQQFPLHIRVTLTRCKGDAVRSRLTLQAWQRRAGAAGNVGLVLLLSLFVYVSIARVVEDHVLTALPLAVNYGFLVILAVARRRPVQTSRRARDWALASTAWLPLILRPADTSEVFAAVGSAIGIIGVILTFVSVAALGRNFGIVAANRGVSTGGVYSVIRHPLYAAETVAMSGFLIANPSLGNLGIVAVTFACIIFRISSEERILKRGSENYGAYARRVRWRLVPGVY